MVEEVYRKSLQIALLSHPIKAPIRLRVNTIYYYTKYIYSIYIQTCQILCPEGSGVVAYADVR